MAEIITFFVGLPLLYLVGDFYGRLGVRLCRSLRQAMPPASTASGDAAVPEIPAVPDDGRYAVALNAAAALLHELAARPDMTPPEQLSTFTFGILHALREVEEQRPGRRVCREPGIN